MSQRTRHICMTHGEMRAVSAVQLQVRTVRIYIAPVSVHDSRVRTEFSSTDLSTKLPRAGFALAIVATHAALLYLGVTLGTVVRRPSEAPIVARFVDAPNQQQPSWTPPPVEPMRIPIEVQAPLAPQIEVPVEIPVTSRQVAAQTLAVASAPAVSDGAPKLVSAVEYIREPIPRYPPQSRRLREQGLVVLRVIIDEKGQACSIEVESSSGHARLDHAAKEAVARAEFRPYIEDGAPRRALVLIPIEFSLTGSKA